MTVRGGGLTTEGESVAFGGVLLDMTGMSRVLHVDAAALTVRTQAGIFWHSLAEELRRANLDYLSAPLNLTSSVGGTLDVGGIDVNSPRLGCSADQAIASAGRDADRRDRRMLGLRRMRNSSSA